MANSSDEDKDSRTALVGASSRTKANPRSTRSASHDSTSRPAKRQRKNQTRKDSGLGNIVPRGGSFSENTLAVDPDSTSSSGSSDSSDADSTSDSDSESERDTDARNPSANPNEGNTTPAISWNQGRNAAVRTTLGKRSAPNEKSTQFTAVNDKYWRSRSDSVSSASDGAGGPETKKAKGSTESAEEDELEEGEVDSKSESDDTSLDSEADDSILLNIGEKANGVDGPHDYDPATLAHQHGSNTTTTMSGGGSSHGKEEAFRQFAYKYPTAPTSLIDLSQQDLEIQAKIIHFSTDIHDLDLRLPVSCIECQREGHLADICPSKECIHCGSWDQHQSSTCPSWRRCQRCRERGHDEPQCESKLRSSASEAPCDYCGQDHLESQCDHLWKFPSRETHSQQTTVSICCANCCSMKHLIGDCESRSSRTKFTSSSFSLSGIDPETITNTNSVGASRNAPPGRPGARARRDWSPPSSDDGDMIARVSRGRGRPVPAPRGNNRGNIQFASGPGGSRYRGPSGPSRGPSGPSRGRPPFPGNGGHRSDPPLPRGPPPLRGGGRGRGRGPSRGGPSRGPRGGGRGRAH
ncbi:unnamed protein product [Penicillium salamii]|uniref:CCHC-type domain-containing protein n=1 Tax=Penicillium salamii TaxID=1612424 RepID=A0A9W4J6V5_9EURO|nr:unnamed protein product [Penicillium salamii]CAG8086480.1 unnamed protein product [Penicillium salamii]CAG8133754.1 unnamed protein product [Penicillium salamii]CAG8184570.1 unnamed protein product [Penicillium salamii]CAG8275792.1 unnamed protein product [Penicillium salamii]